MSNILVIESDTDAVLRLNTILANTFSKTDICYATSVKEAKNIFWHQRFLLILVEIDLLDRENLNLISSLKVISRFVVILSLRDDNELIFHALSQDVDGYILKGQKDSEITELLQSMGYGVPPLSPLITKKILKHLSDIPYRKINNQLSNQESNVLTFLAKGFTRKEISRLMEISINTVSAYTKSIYKKLNINNCSEATLEAVRLGLVAVD